MKTALIFCFLAALISAQRNTDDQFWQSFKENNQPHARGNNRPGGAGAGGPMNNKDENDVNENDFMKKMMQMMMMNMMMKNMQGQQNQPMPGGPGWMPSGMRNPVLPPRMPRPGAGSHHMGSRDSMMGRNRRPQPHPEGMMGMGRGNMGSHPYPYPEHMTGRNNLNPMSEPYGRNTMGHGKDPMMRMREMQMKMMAKLFKGRGMKGKLGPKSGAEEMKHVIKQKLMMCMTKMSMHKLTGFDKLRCGKLMMMVLKEKIKKSMKMMHFKPGPKACNDTMKSNDNKSQCLSPATLNQMAIKREFKSVKESGPYPVDKIKEALKKSIFKVMSNETKLMELHQKAMKVANGQKEPNWAKIIYDKIVMTEFVGPNSPYVNNVTRATTCDVEMHELGEVKYGDKWCTVINPFRGGYATCPNCNCQGVDTMMKEVKERHVTKGQPEAARDKLQYDQNGRQVVNDSDLYVGAYCDAPYSMKHDALVYCSHNDTIYHVDLKLPISCECLTYKWRGCLKVPKPMESKDMWHKVMGGRQIDIRYPSNAMEDIP